MSQLMTTYIQHSVTCNFPGRIPTDSSIFSCSLHEAENLYRPSAPRLPAASLVSDCAITGHTSLTTLRLTKSPHTSHMSHSTSTALRATGGEESLRRRTNEGHTYTDRLQYLLGLQVTMVLTLCTSGSRACWLCLRAWRQWDRQSSTRRGTEGGRDGEGVREEVGLW